MNADAPVTTGLCNERYGHLQATLNEIKACVVGNGKPGWAVRLDRVERILACLLWIMSAIIGAGIVTMVAFFANRALVTMFGMKT